MADAGDHGDDGLRDRARDRFFVEGPEIFERTATSRENEHVDGLLTIEKLKGTDDFESGSVALHANRKQREVHVVEAAAENTNDIADGGARRRGDQADAARQHRERLFAIR